MIGLLAAKLRPYWAQVVLVLGLLLVQAVVNLFLPTLNARLINEGVLAGDTNYILRVGAVMLAITLLFAGVAVLAVYWGARIAMGFGRDVRGALFRRVQQFSQADLNAFGAPSLITRTTNDVQQVQMVVLLMLNIMVLAPITGVGGVIMALRLNVQLSVVILVAVPVMVVFIALVARTALPLFKSMQRKIDRINQVARETLTGVRVIRAFNRSRYEEDRFSLANNDLTATTLRVNRLFALMMPTLTATMNLSTVAIMWFGSLQVADGTMPIGDLTAFLTYIVQILFAVLMATVMFVMVPRAAASAERIRQVLERQPTVVDAERTATAPAHGLVEFRDVEFRYPGAEEPVLCHITFTAMPGETTAIVGGTGSGKSTLLNLIPRLFDVTAGEILVDGVDVREYAQHDLWSRIAAIPQRAFLFNGTVASNLRFGREDASDDLLWRALEVAQAKDFVEELPQRLSAPIEQGGANVSGGQRQRLAIARALVKDAPIILFDDSFSALDFTTDARLRAALRREIEAATVIVVAQRVGSIMHADQIIVIEDGAIAGKGTHEELLRSSPTYREIVTSQFGQDGTA